MTVTEALPSTRVREEGDQGRLLGGIGMRGLNGVAVDLISGSHFLRLSCETRQTVDAMTLKERRSVGR